MRPRSKRKQTMTVHYHVLLTPEIDVRLVALRKRLEMSGPVSEGHTVRMAIVAGLDALEDARR